MCGRFTNRLTWREIVALYRLAVPLEPERNLPARYNICPTDTIDTVIERPFGRREANQANPTTHAREPQSSPDWQAAADSRQRVRPGQLKAGPLFRPSLRNTIAAGQKPVKEACSKFAPTKAVSSNQ
jgi:putative SOS response-associated peptidase YedK